MFVELAVAALSGSVCVSPLGFYPNCQVRHAIQVEDVGLLLWQDIAGL